MPDRSRALRPGRLGRRTTTGSRLACLLCAPLLALGSVAAQSRMGPGVAVAERTRYAQVLVGPLHALLAADAAVQAAIAARGDLRSPQVAEALRRAARTINEERKRLEVLREDVPRSLRDTHDLLASAAEALSAHCAAMHKAATASGKARDAQLVAALRAHSTFRTLLSRFTDAARRDRVPIDRTGF